MASALRSEEGRIQMLLKESFQGIYDKIDFFVEWKKEWELNVSDHSQMVYDMSIIRPSKTVGPDMCQVIIIPLFYNIPTLAPRNHGAHNLVVFELYHGGAGLVNQTALVDSTHHPFILADTLVRIEEYMGIGRPGSR